MTRSVLACALLSSLLMLAACKPHEGPSKEHPLDPMTPTTPSPDPASNPRPGPSSKTSLPLKTGRQQALERCEAFMGFEKNDCLDKARQDYPQTLA